MIYANMNSLFHCIIFTLYGKVANAFCLEKTKWKNEAFQNNLKN